MEMRFPLRFTRYLGTYLFFVNTILTKNALDLQILSICRLPERLDIEIAVERTGSCGRVCAQARDWERDRPQDLQDARLKPNSLWVKLNETGRHKGKMKSVIAKERKGGRGKGETWSESEREKEQTQERHKLGVRTRVRRVWRHARDRARYVTNEKLSCHLRIFGYSTQLKFNDGLFRRMEKIVCLWRMFLLFLKARAITREKDETWLWV